MRSVFCHNPIFNIIIIVIINKKGDFEELMGHKKLAKIFKEIYGLYLRDFNTGGIIDEN